MSDPARSTPQQSSSTPAAPLVRTFVEFLESAPPDSIEAVTNLVETHQGHTVLSTAQLTLHCSNSRCNGDRVFDCSECRYLTTNFEYEFLTYVCRNCGETKKTFALAVMRSSMKVQKLGELPPFGPPTPARLITLVGADRELFLKGRRAELRGLGIGAFAYYRRVVEDKKGTIIGEIARVAERLGAPSGVLDQFTAAQEENQFGSAIEKIKAAIPQSLLIDGHNPLTLLHSALSEGLHARTDAECLELARSIRVVLVELAERIAAALKDEAELRDAVSRLLRKQ